MAKTIKIRKGFDIKLKGEALKFESSPSAGRIYSIKPRDFKGVIPKLLVENGSEVKAGDPLFYSKVNSKMVFVSPVSGEVVEIKRGEKRVILEIKILSDSKNNFVEFGSADPNHLSSEEIKDKMLSSGVWPFIRQRPYNKIADPEITPKSVFISGFDSAPLGVDYNYVLSSRVGDFQAGINVLSKLSGSKIHLNLNKSALDNSVLESISNVEITYFEGPHPAGNVGVQIHHIDPINKGDVVWVVNPQDVAIIGRFFQTGRFDTTKLIALTGTGVTKRCYYKTMIGAIASTFVENNLEAGEQRIISGNVLTGTRIDKEEGIGFYDNMVTVIPEGKEEEFLGWLVPTYPRPSMSKTMPAFLHPERRYEVNTNMHGENRAFVVSGEYEKVLPMDILPVHLLKACMANDIENMEALGIYEVDAEDFALCEFVCTSKSPLQEIISQGLELVEKEA